MVIFDYYQTLSEKERIAFREEVIKRLGIAQPTFYYKIRNDCWRAGERELTMKIIMERQHA